jgi:nitrite reductase/ring-hydroxylating ferredoxin subunit
VTDSDPSVWTTPPTSSARLLAKGLEKAGRLPGVHVRPRTQPISADVWKMIRWTTWTPYGAHGKPRRLEEIPWDYVKEFEGTIPFRGLREFWYPVFPSRELRNNEPKPLTLLGDDLVVFRDERGHARTLSAVCPHRQTLLSLGQVGVFKPGTITCRYHGLTFDGEGECVAALTEGPESRLPGRIRTRAYPTDERAGMIWIYTGKKPPPDVYDAVPHARDTLTLPWKYHPYWEFPVNWLSLMDNFADPLHPSIAHSTCAHFRDQKLWDQVWAEPQECGGLAMGFRGVGPPNRGPHSLDRWEVHLPGYLVFTHVTPPTGPEPTNHGGLGFVVPIDIGRVRLIDMTSYGGPLLPRIRDRLKYQLLGHKWGLPNSIYYCNKGPDQAMMVSQGRVPNWTQESRIRGDQPIVKWRRMLKEAYSRELADGEASGLAPQDEERETALVSSAPAKPRGEGVAR